MVHDHEKTVGTSPAAVWTPPAPRDLADWRLRLRDHVASPTGHLMLAEMIRTGRTTLAPATTPHTTAAAASILARGEADRLTDAALYYVTAEMTAWAHAAAATPPTEPVHTRRLPAPAGLMLFAAPIGSYTQNTDIVFTPYAAASAPPAPPPPSTSRSSRSPGHCGTPTAARCLTPESSGTTTTATDTSRRSHPEHRQSG